MKVLAIALTVLALMAGAATADLSLYGSYWNTDELDDTWGAGARLRGGIAEPLWIELRGAYFDDLTGDRGLSDFELECIPVDLGLALVLINEEGGKLYLAGGGSYYFLDSNRGDVDDEIGWYAGVGGEVQLNLHVALFAEALFRQVEATVEDDDLDLIDDSTTDINLDGVAVNVGLVIR